MAKSKDYTFVWNIKMEGVKSFSDLFSMLQIALS